MSKVQSPTSYAEASQASEARKPEDQRGKPHVGHWALDIGRGTLDVRLKVTDLRKSFSSPSGERIEVLRGVSLFATAGESIAIMGASGAGKSTLLHLLGGLEAADHGSVHFGEFAIERVDSSALAAFRNNRVGFVFQFHHLLIDLTAAENVSLPLMIARTSRREAMQRATKMLEGAGLGARVSHLVRHLSGGEQQRVAICRALITRPALVLADEPTGNVDTAIGGEIADSLISYAKEAQGIVIIASHNQKLATLCDRTLILKDGRLCKV